MCKLKIQLNPQKMMKNIKGKSIQKVKVSDKSLFKFTLSH